MPLIAITEVNRNGKNVENCAKDSIFAKHSEIMIISKEETTLVETTLDNY